MVGERKNSWMTNEEFGDGVCSLLHTRFNSNNQRRDLTRVVVVYPTQQSRSHMYRCPARHSSSFLCVCRWQFRVLVGGGHNLFFYLSSSHMFSLENQNRAGHEWKWLLPLGKKVGQHPLLYTCIYSPGGILFLSIRGSFSFFLSSSRFSSFLFLSPFFSPGDKKHLRLWSHTHTHTIQKKIFFHFEMFYDQSTTKETVCVSVSHWSLGKANGSNSQRSPLYILLLLYFSEGVNFFKKI